MMFSIMSMSVLADEEEEEDNHSHAIILSDEEFEALIGDAEVIMVDLTIEEFEALAEQARQEGALSPTPRHAHRWYYNWMAFRDRCYGGSGNGVHIINQQYKSCTVSGCWEQTIPTGSLYITQCSGRC